MIKRNLHLSVIEVGKPMRINGKKHCWMWCDTEHMLIPQVIDSTTETRCSTRRRLNKMYTVGNRVRGDVAV